MLRHIKIVTFYICSVLKEETKNRQIFYSNKRGFLPFNNLCVNLKIYGQSILYFSIYTSNNQMS